tara:strand:- start:295 stop:1122 length:828 start_codon:yes stop_codon:yes gene_type:complete
MLIDLSVGIIGYGFVGGAVSYGFQTPGTKQYIIDPKLGSTIGKDLPKDVNVVFVCVPTPMNDDFSVNSSIVEKTVIELLEHTEHCPIVIKSTVTPDKLKKLPKDLRVIYNPEFLTEKNANEDFINPKMHVFGGDPGNTHMLEHMYNQHSLCRPCPVFHMKMEEASLVKYGINSFLATKVLWFNQFFDVVADEDANYNRIITAISTDPRIGNSHTLVPGFDGKRGFGGACFPKDTTAFSSFAPEFTVLKKVIEENNKYRRGYEKDERELEQNVNYG